jgi:hypothetical protein
MFCLGYMMDIESHTIIYLRETVVDVDCARADDNRLPLMLGLRGVFPFASDPATRREPGRWGRRYPFYEPETAQAGRHDSPGGRAILSRMTRHFPAVHMAWGAINELSTLTGYRALMRRTGHPLATTVLSRIVKDEWRHFSFYFNRSRIPLQPRAARLLTSLEL